MFSVVFDFIESCIRSFIIWFVDLLPVKVIRDDHGVPFLYRYHLFAFTKNGPGMCIHRFVKSDPDRGYHDHPWEKSMSFILCGRYDERIYDKNEECGYKTVARNRWNFNYLDGIKTFHRVMVEEGKDVWTIFAFQKRSKTWGMISLKGDYNPMSTTVEDKDGGWWNTVMRGIGLHEHLDKGKVIATCDNIIIAENKILLIMRGKDPCKGMWAFPGGRIEQRDKSVHEAALRELKEETNLTLDLNYYAFVGNNTRDPRGFTLTSIYYAILDEIPLGVKAGDDAVDYEWFDLDNLPEMAFDHRKILNRFVTSIYVTSFLNNVKEDDTVSNLGMIYFPPIKNDKNGNLIGSQGVDYCDLPDLE